MAIFLNENKVAGLPAKQSGAQAGISNVDTNVIPEVNLGYPVLLDPAVTWLAYRCWVETELDAGMVLHKPLPQSPQDVDTLASVDVDDKKLEDSVLGINLKSVGNYADVVQRMATSTYIFKLMGWALRASYTIPIPGIVSIAGRPVVPAEVQRVRGPLLAGQFGGVPLYYAAWELWYYVILPPQGKAVAPPNLAAHIRGDDPLPKEMAVPASPPDWNAVPAMKQAPDMPPGGPVEVR